MVHWIAKRPSKSKVHRLRLLSRRLRSAWPILQKISPGKGLKGGEKSLAKLTRILGTIRSLDVSKELLQQRLQIEDPKASLSFLPKTLGKKADRARQTIDKKAWRKKVRKVERYFGPIIGLTPPESNVFAAAVQESTERGSDKVLHSWKSFENKKTLKSLHRLRIALKKWRYSLEIEVQCLGGAQREQLLKAKSLQDQLGEIHDLQVVLSCLEAKSLRRKSKRQGATKRLRKLRNSLRWEIQGKAQDFLLGGRKPLFSLISTRSP